MQAEEWHKRGMKEITKLDVHCKDMQTELKQGWWSDSMLGNLQCDFVLMSEWLSTFRRITVPSVWQQLPARQQNVTLQNTWIFSNTALQHAYVFMSVSVAMPSQGTEPEPHIPRLSDSEWMDTPHAAQSSAGHGLTSDTQTCQSCSSPLSHRSRPN
jgi:hypothetical protein